MRAAILKLVDVSKQYNNPLFLPRRHRDRTKIPLSIDSISFTLHRGESIGIIGANGAGKSTLLKVIAGHLVPSSGSIESAGRIRALIELGAGMDREQTGHANAKFYFDLQGLPKNNREEYLKAVHEFSELGESFFQPVKAYSTGMFVRLAYSIQSLLPADVLIIDEALAVGDVRFQQKCFAHLESLKSRGVSFLFVSHSTEQIRILCDRVIFIRNGKVAYDGDVASGCDLYLKSLFSSSGDDLTTGNVSAPCHSDQESKVGDVMLNDHPLFFSDQARYGENVGMIAGMAILADGHEVTGPILDTVHKMAVRVIIRNNRYADLMFGITIVSKEGAIILGSNNFIDSVPLSVSPGINPTTVEIEFDSFLKAGDYFIEIGVCEVNGASGGRPLDVIPRCIHLSVESNRRHINAGLVRSQMKYFVR